MFIAKLRNKARCTPWASREDLLNWRSGLALNIGNPPFAPKINIQSETKKMSLLTLPTVALLVVAVTGTPAIAGGSCDNSSLVGSYAFHVQGANLGLLDASNTLHLFKEPEPFAGVGEYTFDGNGGFTRVDYNVGLGIAAFPPTTVNDQDFRTSVTGTYSVSADCTATFTVALAAGSQVVLAVALVDYGARAFLTFKSETVSSFSPVNNTSDFSCDAGCNVAAQFTGEIDHNSTHRR
jgi:hypothetical protein